MAPSPFSFRPAPPPRPEGRALGWVLAAAYAQPLAVRLGEDERAAAAELARALDLAARLATRLGRERLEAELGAARAEPLLTARARTAARGLAILEAAAAVGRLARDTGTPLAWLKFAGLAATGVDVVGRRGASDLDLLVPEAAAPPLVAALEATGFRRSPMPQPEHQIATLAHPELGAVEIHRGVPGVELPGTEPQRGSARFERIEGAGLLADGARVAPGTRTLAPVLLAAHALVHGAWQSGRSASYPHLRIFADLLDLAEACEGLRPERLVPFVEGALAREDVEALCAIASALTAGRPPRRQAGAEKRSAVTEERSAVTEERSALWLDHFLALALSADYALASRARAAFAGHEPGGALLSRLRRLRRLIALSPAEIEAVYGPQPGRGAILARQLARPFDLLRRAWASRAARRRLERAGRES